MTATAPGYCLDTSAWLDGWRRYYPIDTFPSVWDRVEGLILAGRLFWAEEVAAEIQDGDLLSWLAPHVSGVVESALIWNDAAAVLRRFNPVQDLKGITGADPFVIAAGRARALTVVTGEQPGQGRPKIPDACRELGIGCMGFLAMLRQERWTF